MLNTHWAIVRDGRIEMIEKVEIPDGTKVLVTLLPDNDRHFWLRTSQTALDSVWDNSEDEVYGRLLQE